MNSHQIESALKRVTLFKGVYACDNLPNTFKKPAAFIVNTDGQREKGEHWVVLIVLETRVEYFDPLGFPPFDPNFIRFIRMNARKKYYYNCKTVQNPESSKCGNYCIAFIKHRASHKSFRSFLQKFSKNTKQNDKLIAEM